MVEAIAAYAGCFFLAVSTYGAAAPRNQHWRRL